MAWQERNDYVPGIVYMLEAEGYGGFIPGIYKRRIKLGLTRNLDQRLDTLHSSQPCCNYKVVRAIHVDSMAQVEGELHQIFKKQNVKLIKSREWFDVLPHQYAKALWLFSRYDSKRDHKIPPRLVTGGLVALLGVGLLIGYTSRQSSSEGNTLAPQVTISANGETVRRIRLENYIYTSAERPRVDPNIAATGETVEVFDKNTKYLGYVRGGKFHWQPSKK